LAEAVGSTTYAVLPPQSLQGDAVEPDYFALFVHTHDHGSNTDLLADDHTQYALLAGRAANQTLVGGTTASGSLTHQSTAGMGTTDFVRFLVGNNGAVEAMRILTSGAIGIGTTTVTNPGKVEIKQTITANTGTAHTLRVENQFAPTAAADNNITAINVLNQWTNDNAAGNSTGSLNAGIFVASNRSEQLLANLSGNTAQAALGPTSGAAVDGATATTMRGMVMLALDNALTGTTTRMMASYSEARNSGTQTITRMTGHIIGVGSTNSGSGAGVITEAMGLRVGGRDQSLTNILLAGTITSAVMVEIDDWLSGAGVTYTDDPIQLRLNALTETGAIAIQQLGTVGHNRIQGFTMIGVNAAPDAPLEINSTASLGQQLLTLDQDDTDQPFVDFQGNTGANATASISTFTVAGATAGFIQIEINGTKRWIQVYNDPTA
jgi:hypothetical protein